MSGETDVAETTRFIRFYISKFLLILSSYTLLLCTAISGRDSLEWSHSIFQNLTKNKALPPYSTFYSVYHALVKKVMEGKEIDLSGIYFVKTNRKTFNLMKK